MKLSIPQKREMYENGFVRIKGVVPQMMVREALRAINYSIVTHGIPPDKLPIFHSQSFCPETTRMPAIFDLFNKTPAKELVESLLEPGKVSDQKGGQIALRFPAYADPPHVGGPHIDGTYSPTNGVKEGTINPFTMLAAVFLSDVPEPYCGNFSAWPGTHRVFEKYFREHGPLSLLKGLPPVEMPPPTQVITQPGDLVLAHYQVAHSVAVNVSPNIRYAIFFRVTHADHAKEGYECMTSIWQEWAGMQEVLPENERTSKSQERVRT